MEIVFPAQRDRPDVNLQMGTRDTINLQMGQGINATGTRDYEKLINKPSINDIELSGRLNLDTLGIQKADEAPTEKITNSDIESILSLWEG